MRTRSKWRDTGRAHSLSENATALAYVCWRIALARARNLHAEDFDYENDRQRTSVIAEYLCFFVHIADRIVHGSLGDDDRATFVSTLAGDVARHYQRNLEDVFGRGRDYRGGFIELMNERIAEYSGYRFEDGSPGFQMLRGLGRNIQDVMGESQTNRWIIDHVMELDAPAAVQELNKAMDDLFGTANVAAHDAPPK